MFSDDAYPRDLQYLFSMTSSLMAPGAAARMANGSANDAAPSSHDLLQRLDRPYCCPVPDCGGRFHRKFTLHEHMKTHTGEKPHACPIASCGKRFSTSGNLARHKRLHTLSKLKCPVTTCTRVFTKKEKLIRHLKVHMGSTTHTCSVADCSKTFSTAGNLTRHMKTQHPTLVIAKASAAGATATTSATTAPSVGAKARSELLPDRIIVSQSVAMSADEDVATGANAASAVPGSPLCQFTPNISPAQSPVPTNKALDYEILELLDCLFVPDGGAAVSSDCHGVVEPLSATSAFAFASSTLDHPLAPPAPDADSMLMYL